MLLLRLLRLLLLLLRLLLLLLDERMMSSLLRTVFVYGTLKRGQPNHPLLCDPTIGNASFLSPAHTRDRHPLVVSSRYSLPFLLPVPGKGEVRGSGEPSVTLCVARSGGGVGGATRLGVRQAMQWLWSVI